MRRRGMRRRGMRRRGGRDKEIQGDCVHAYLGGEGRQVHGARLALLVVAQRLHDLDERAVDGGEHLGRRRALVHVPHCEMEGRYK